MNFRIFKGFVELNHSSLKVTYPEKAREHSHEPKNPKPLVLQSKLPKI